MLEHYCLSANQIAECFSYFNQCTIIARRIFHHENGTSSVALTPKKIGQNYMAVL